MLKNIKIAYKIYILGFTQLFLMLIMGGIAISQMSKIGIELIDIAEKDIPLTNSISLLTSHQLEQSILIERALFNAALMKQDIPHSHEHFLELKKEVTSLSHQIQEEVTSIDSFIKQSVDSLNSEAAKKEFKHLSSTIETIGSHIFTFEEELAEFLIYIESASLNDIANKSKVLEQHEDDIKHEVTRLLTEVQNFTLKASLQAEKDEQTGIVWIITAFIIAVIIGLILPFIIGKSITKPINNLADRLSEVANGDGDLTISLNDSAKDETGDVARAFNQFLSILRNLIGNTTAQASVLDQSSTVAMNNMSTTVENVDKQRVETEMVASAVNQMSATTQVVASNATDSAQATEVVKSKMLDSSRDAVETQTIIKQLSQEVTETSTVIQNLVNETNNIGNVLEAIQGIASQTNLLALNAAIEAARAGETGRGFAVVADEVRTLAQRTQSSTVDIQELLKRIKEEANNAVISMDKGTESANACITKSEHASQTLKEASESVMIISDLNTQIVQATNEQTCVVEEINQNLVNISQMADDTYQGARDTSEANASIDEQIVQLQQNLNAFLV